MSEGLRKEETGELNVGMVQHNSCKGLSIPMTSNVSYFSVSAGCDAMTIYVAAVAAGISVQYLPVNKNVCSCRCGDGWRMLLSYAFVVMILSLLVREYDEKALFLQSEGWLSKRCL